MTHEEKISRLKFLKEAGFKGGALMALLSSCVRPEDTFVPAETVSTATGTVVSTTTPATGGTTTTTPATGGTNAGVGTVSAVPTTAVSPSSITKPLVTIDLTTANGIKLKTVGSYVIVSSIVIARASTGAVVAATQTCTHEPKKKIIWSNNEYYCTDHGARFTAEGKGLNSLASKGLTVYKIAADATKLVVYA